MTWNSRVNFEDCCIAEANHVQIPASTRCDLPRDAPSRCKRQPRQHLFGEVATITDVTVLQMGKRMAFRLQLRDKMKRVHTTYPEIRPCSSSMNMGRRNNATPPFFAWCVWKRVVALLRRPCFLPRKCLKTATWSHSVKSEDFLVAEASDVLEMRLPYPSANLASISSSKRLKIRDNVKRFDTIFTELLEEFSDLIQELKRTDDHLPPASGACPGHLCSGVGRAPFPQKRTTLQSTASSLRCSLAASDSLEIGSSMAKDKTNSCEADPNVYENAVIGCVLGQCRCQSAWMDGAASCSWVFVCESAYVHLCIKSQGFGPFMIKTQMRFFTK